MRFQGAFLTPTFQSPFFSKLRLANEHVEQRKKAGYTHEEAVNLTSLELAQTAEAHCRAFLVQSGHEMIEKLCQRVSPALAKVMRTVGELYAYNEALDSIGSLVRVSVIWRRGFPAVADFSSPLSSQRSARVTLIDCSPSWNRPCWPSGRTR